MDKEKLKQFIKSKGRFNVLLVFFNIALMIGSMAGIAWIAENNHRTLFGAKINIIESRMLNDKKIIKNYNTGIESEQIKSLALKYCELSLGQIFIIRQLIDLGFLAFLFWNGFVGLAVSISFKRFTKRIGQFVDNE